MRGGAISPTYADADFLLLSASSDMEEDIRQDAIRLNKVALRYSWIVACIKEGKITPWWEYAYFAPTDGTETLAVYEEKWLKSAETESQMMHIHRLAAQCAFMVSIVFSQKI
jgi:hypothetical protein